MSHEPDVRERILAVATRLFADQGYGSTSVRQVAEAVGVTKPALYYYFKSKEELFEQIICSHLGRVSAILDEALGGGGTLREQLQRLLDGVAAEAADQPDLVRFLLLSHHRPDQSQPRMDVMLVHMSRVGVLQQTFEVARARGELRGDLPLDALVMTFVGMMNHHLMSRVRTHHPSLSAAVLLDIFFHGAAAPSKVSR
ncbi:MAG: TetR/AcrR family transcriptional regulator [Deltaproteobacteria bacterium]|nr:TetR/AcrR family transcriptional regulator [Deltaproteobacteria bacterium]